MNYHQADDYAAQLVETGKARIAFVTVSLTHSGFDVATYETSYGSPIKRYLRHSTGAVEVKAVSNWRRN